MASTKTITIICVAGCIAVGGAIYILSKQYNNATRVRSLVSNNEVAYTYEDAVAKAQELEDGDGVKLVKNYDKPKLDILTKNEKDLTMYNKILEDSGEKNSDILNADEPEDAMKDDLRLDMVKKMMLHDDDLGTWRRITQLEYATMNQYHDKLYAVWSNDGLYENDLETAIDTDEELCKRVLGIVMDEPDCNIAYFSNGNEDVDYEIEIIRKE